MSKSMYSLILMDEVVAAVDKQAHEKGTSRSNLINRILAQHLSLMTPELCISRIFSEAVRALATQSALQPLPATGTVLTVRGILPYKYNPTIRFIVDVAEAGAKGCSGHLRVSSRSQSAPLLQKLNIFFELWSQIEATCIPERFSGTKLRHEIESGRLVRTMQTRSLEEDIQPDEVGQSVGAYLILMQNSLTRCFEAEFGIDIPVYTAMMEAYRGYLDNHPVCI